MATDITLKAWSDVLGKSFDYGDGCRYITYLGTVTNSAMWVDLPTPVAPGSEIVALPINPGNPSDPINSNRLYVFGSMDLSADGKQVQYVYEKHRIDYNRGEVVPTGEIKRGNVGDAGYVFPAASFPTMVFALGNVHTDMGGFGLKIYNGSDYNVITDGTNAGACVWAYKGKAKSGFQLPTSVLGSSDLAFFARWHLPNRGVLITEDNKLRFEYDPNDTSGGTAGGAGLIPGGEDTGSEIDISIVAFAGKVTLPVTPGGINVWNAKGDVTLSSNYPPIKTLATMQYGDWILWNGNNSTSMLFKKEPIPIADGMIPLSRCAGVIILPIILDPNNQWHSGMFQTGVVMTTNDNTVQVFKFGKNVVPDIPTQYYPVRGGVACNMNLPVLSEADYFN